MQKNVLAFLYDFRILVDYAKITGDKPKQPANEIFSIKRKFQLFILLYLTGS